MKFHLKEILERFFGLVARWLASKQSGELLLSIKVHDGGVVDWNMTTQGKGE